MRPEAQAEPSCFRNARFSTKATRHPVVQISFFSGGGEVLARRPAARWPPTGRQPPAPCGDPSGFLVSPKGCALTKCPLLSPEGQSCALWVTGIGWALERVLGTVPGSGLPCWEPQPTRPPKPQEAVEAAERGAAPAPHPCTPLPPSSLL